MPGAFSIALLVVLALGIAIRESCMAVTTGVLIANWLACVMLTMAEDGSGLNWFGMGVIDFCSAALLLLFAHRRWQMIVVAVFAVMIACHLLRWWMPAMASPHVYLDALSFLSWAQLATVMGRGVHVIIRSAKGDAPVHGGVSDPVLHRREDGGVS